MRKTHPHAALLSGRLFTVYRKMSCDLDPDRIDRTCCTFSTGTGGPLGAILMLPGITASTRVTRNQVLLLLATEYIIIVYNPSSSYYDGAGLYTICII